MTVVTNRHRGKLQKFAFRVICLSIPGFELAMSLIGSGSIVSGLSGYRLVFWDMTSY